MDSELPHVTKNRNERKHSRNRGQRLIVYAAVLKLCVASFYIGYRNTAFEGKIDVNAAVGGSVDADVRSDCATDVADISELSESMRRKISQRTEEELARGGRGGDQTRISNGKLFPDTVRGFAVGALRVSTDEMLGRYDFGVPVKKLEKKGRRSDSMMQGDPESIILYNTLASVPSSDELGRDAIHGINGVVAKSSVPDAMERCDTLNVIFTALNNDTDCHLLIGDFESYHINRWLRMPVFDSRNKKNRKLDHALPLRHVGRITQNKNGVDIFELPDVWSSFKYRKKGFLLEHFDRMRTFLENVDDVLKDVKDILTRRNVVRDNTVVVLTVNSGQSELLINFICAAKSRGIDTGNVLVFPTDEVSFNLARGLGVAAYYDEKNFGKMPMGAARAYGDIIFANMMFAKVLCVLYVSLLGHDVLFQDVDIVWFKDPLTYFHDKSNTAIQDFDIMFQHDGNAQSRYSPFSANSGFYYVRSNKKTSYLFTSLLYHGAIIRKSKSHQQVLVQLLNEHSSMFGLKVKVFDASQTDMFPGGYHYHQHWETMHAIISGKSNAYILHMSWTENKVNKVLFFRQMGEWYVHDKCIGDDASNLIDGNVADGALVEQCCSAEPIFSCHFKDKPSKVPCPDSPRIDPLKRRSFW
ncbi:hypothetical protein ACHAXA_005938 [Cyclostephanos tholiformis]|uniref:Nucleotide-diphospho-sugar transferase domain-containing protein n=1 Tax=Cyclostephanos tholiformis TaxID=382380 RepID=A0ABD3RDN5_9STRA